MQFIEEIVVDEFLPTFRSMLAESLRDRGLTQSEVAALLGISQSAVSKYVHGDVDTNTALLADDRLTEHVERLAEGLANDDVSPVQALVETEILIRQLERGGTLAKLHEEAVPALAEYDSDFAIHDPDSGLRQAERTLSDLRRGLRTLENTSGFTGLIPAVGSNLAQSLPDAGGIEDVAAVPGRILDVKGRATIPADPEFGVSEHVASMLLAAQAAGHDAQAVLNVRYDEDVLAALEAADYEIAAFDPEAELTDAIAVAIDDAGSVDVLYQSGGFGIEPIVYLLGPDAPTVAERVRALV